MADRDIIADEEAFLWCWRRRPLVRPEVAASGGTGSRPHAQRHRGVVGVCGTGIQSPRTEDPRCYLVKQLHGRAEDVDTKRIPADPIRDHVPGTVSPARQGGLFGWSGQV